MIFGIDYLGGAKYGNVILKNHPRGYAAGFFANTFGDALPIVQKLAKSGKCPLIRIQGVWSTNNHTFGAKEEALATKECRRFNELAKKYPGVTFLYSPYCEHKKKADDMVKLFKKLSPSHMTLINCPISGGQYVTGYKNEIHHSDTPSGNKGDFLFSFDGLHCVDADIEKFKRDNSRAEVFFFWTLQFNLKKNHKDKTPISQRKCKPTDKLIKSLSLFANQKAVVSLMNGWLYKSHAEQHNDVDLRANKPVILTPKGKRVGKVELFLGSKRVATLVASGTTDNRQVWRCSKWGYELGGVLTVKADGKTIGTVDANWRQNEYRNKGGE